MIMHVNMRRIFVRRNQIEAGVVRDSLPIHIDRGDDIVHRGYLPIRVAETASLVVPPEVRAAGEQVLQNQLLYLFL
jgi:hypothetical protein